LIVIDAAESPGAIASTRIGPAAFEAWTIA